jgi:hypothetical protein
MNKRYAGYALLFALAILCVGCGQRGFTPLMQAANPTSRFFPPNVYMRNDLHPNSVSPLIHIFST